MRHLKTALSVLGAATVLILAANTITYAATGQAVLLGKSNTANTTTALTRTTAGSALKVVTSTSSAAPFQVNGKGLVHNLNADRVDNLQASQLRTTVNTFEISPTGFEGSSFSMPLPLSTGRYLMTYTATFDNIGGFTYCWFEQVTNPGSPDEVKRIIGEDIYEGNNLAGLNGHGVVAINATTNVALSCTTDAGELFWQDSQPVQVTAQRIDAGNGGRVLTFE